jgi:hypothetical protein
MSDDLAGILKDYVRVMEGQADDGVPSVYFHTQSTRDLSSSVGDVLYKIQDLEARRSMHLGAHCCSPECRYLMIEHLFHWIHFVMFPPSRPLSVQSSSSAFYCSHPNSWVQLPLCQSWTVCYHLHHVPETVATAAPGLCLRMCLW